MGNDFADGFAKIGRLILAPKIVNWADFGSKSCPRRPVLAGFFVKVIPAGLTLGGTDFGVTGYKNAQNRPFQISIAI